MEYAITMSEIMYSLSLISMEMELTYFATLNVIMYLEGHSQTSHVELPKIYRNVRVTDHTHTESMSAHHVNVRVAMILLQHALPHISVPGTQLPS